MLRRSRGASSRESPIRKVVDDTDSVRSASGLPGTLREEVWCNSRNEVVRYNLAYINHHVFAQDNGRVLGYDNAHGVHERHESGAVQTAEFTTYEDRLREFLEEVRAWRQRT